MSKSTSTTLSFKEPSPSEIRDLLQFSFKNYIEELSKSSSTPENELIEKIGPPPTKQGDNHHWKVICVEGESAGYYWMEINLESKTSYLWDLYIKPEFRSKGLGKLVMTSILENLKAQGIQSMSLSVLEDNKIARDLYSKIGFLDEKFTPEYRQYLLKLELNKI